MKKVPLLIPLFLATIVSCNNPTTESSVSTTISASNESTALIADSIRNTINGFVKAMCEVNVDKQFSFFSKSPQLRIIDQDGQLIDNVDSLYAGIRGFYSGLSHQEVKPVEPYINVISANSAVATYASEFTTHQKDKSTMGGTFGWTFLFAKENGEWKIVNLHQSIKWREAQKTEGKK